MGREKKASEKQTEFEPEAIEGELIVVPEKNSRDLAVSREPEIVLEEARKAAQALKNVLEKKKKKVMFNGKQYLEFEDWGLLAKFYGVMSKVVETKYVEYGDVRGFEAKAQVIHVPTGNVISAAEAMCLNDEENWGLRAKYKWITKPGGAKEKIKIGEEKVPLFQLKSMAQTRACAKALRNVLSWVVVLAGFAPTPAEDMKEYENKDVHPDSSEKPVKQKTNAAPTPKPDDIPEEKLGEFVLTFGKFNGYKLSNLVKQQDENGNDKGLEYLEWLVENAKNPKDPTVLIIRRFLEVVYRWMGAK